MTNNRMSSVLIVIWALIELCAAQCQRPDGLDANIQLSPDLMTYSAGSFITVACMDGSTMTDGATFTLCQSNAFSFSLTDVVCSLDCEDPAANQQSLNKTGEIFQHGDTANYTCAENYNTLHGPETTTCNNGEWSPLPSDSSCRAPCEAPSAASPRGLYENGESRTFSCDTSPSDVATLTCNDGNWDGTDLTCSGCALPTSLDANIQLTPDRTTYLDGSFITVACMDGSTMTAGATFTICQSDSFSFPLTDVVCSLDCDDPAANQESLEKSGETFQHGETATYTCAENYNTLHGPETTTCNNGEWSPLPSETSCRAPCYSPPASQPEGDYENGVSQTFTCDNSLDQASLECNDGSWSDPSFTCPEPVSTEVPFETTKVDIIVTDEATQRSLATDMTTSLEVSALFTEFSTDSFYSTDRKTTAVSATSSIEPSEAVTDGETIRMTESNRITVITKTERVSDPDTSTLAEIATETGTQTTERDSTDTNTDTVLSTGTGYGTDESTDVVETEADTVTATTHELRTDSADFTETVTSVVTRFSTDITDEDITETIAVTNVYTEGDTNATQTEMLATKSATTDYAEVTFTTTVDAFTTERTLLSTQTVTVSSADPSTGVTENEVTDVFTERQTTSLLDVSASQTTLTDVETESATSIYTDQGTDRDATTETEGYTDEMTLGVTATDVVVTDDNVNTITERGGTDGISEAYTETRAYTERETAFTPTDSSSTENTDSLTEPVATYTASMTTMIYATTNELTERPTMETANTAVYTQTENQQETEPIEPTASRTATSMQTEIQTTVYTNSDTETSTDAAVTQTQTELDPASTSGVTGITTDTITSGERTDITTSSRTIRITTEVDEITDKRTTEAPEPTVPEEPCGTGSCTDGQYCAESSNGPVCVCQPDKELVDDVCRDECSNACDFETELCEENAEGGYSCSCRPGSTRDTVTGQCISESVTWRVM
ncbi:uncharacterized protein [Diadema setosum]|uniref:uncharacterized protein n=1 Tax=Diadema setosum TaxID=31175 RepID=UPI003B3B4855